MCTERKATGLFVLASFLFAAMICVLVETTILGYIFIEHLFFKKNYPMILYESLGTPS